MRYASNFFLFFSCFMQRDLLQPGKVVIGRVSKLIPRTGLNVQLSAHTYGRVFMTDIDDDYKDDPLSGMLSLRAV